MHQVLEHLDWPADAVCGHWQPGLQSSLEQAQLRAGQHSRVLPESDTRVEVPQLDSSRQTHWTLLPRALLGDES